MGPSQTAPALPHTSRQPGAVSRPYTGVQCPMADTASPDPPELRLDQHHSTVPPPERAAWLLRNVRQRGDEYGDVANATPDELRDALVLAAAALNAAQAPDVFPEATPRAFVPGLAMGDVVASVEARDPFDVAPGPDPVSEAADAERLTVGQLMDALDASMAAVRHAEPAG